MKKLLTLLLAMLLLAGCAGNKPGTFEAGKNTFLLNGKPFIVKAAEVHYPRIPREYWEHRIEMCKALGDRKSTRLNSSHRSQSRMPSSA